MRNLSPTLIAAQQSPDHIPYVKLQARNVINGLVRLEWERLYSGLEEDFHHAATMPGDGSLIRIRITPIADGRKLYRQRVPGPGPSSDFSNWTYTNQYNCLVVATASLGTEVSIFWINTSRQLRRIKSIDNGATWDSPETIDYSPSTTVNSLAAAYKPNGDIAVFFGDQSVLYAKKYTGGSWQPKTAWDKTTGDLSGITVVYDGDWCLLVTGTSVADDFKVWWLVYGDGYQLPVGNWSVLNEMASAPAGGNFVYSRPFLDKPDVFRCFFIEQYSGIESYNRPFWSHSIPGSGFISSLWRESVPFNLSSEYGLVMAHHGTFCWLSAPYGVWRASLEIKTLDLTTDMLYLKNTTDSQQGKLSVELRNDDGRYSSLPSLLSIGNQLDMSPGYLTPAGNEVSNGQAFLLQTYEHTSSRGKASLWLEAQDGWAAIGLWTARHQFRWNKESSEKSVKDILAFVVGRAGLKLEVKSESDVITGYFPDFTIHPGDCGNTIISRLLSFVPDAIFIEGAIAYIANPQISEPSSYSYGTLHPILEGHYRIGTPDVNRTQVEGYDPVSGQPIIAESFDWTEIAALYDRLVTVQDRNLDTLDRVRERGNAFLHKAGIAATEGEMTVPVNCGQQVYDVIEVTDMRTGLKATKKRIMGLILLFEPRSGRYEHRLVLGAV